jgi:hypothetical protein
MSKSYKQTPLAQKMLICNKGPFFGEKKMAIFTYDTYQDVRQNLFRYSVPFLIFAGFFAFLRILPSEHQKAVTQLIEYASTRQPWKGALGTGLGIGAFTVIAFVLTEILQIHDKWYDRYVTKWRHRYATDFILPRLVQPFANFLNYRFHEQAEIYTRQFQEQLFYPFVGDRDLKIPKNRLVRFYEAITPYWLTIINEIVLLFLIALIAVYRFVGPPDLAYRTALLTNCLIVGFVFIGNRLAMQRYLALVRTATSEEIRAIHEDPELVADLGCRLANLCSDYGVPYNA